MQLITGDSLEKLKTLPESSVDSIVTDPPYGLSFMGKKWDYDVPSTDLWKEAMRVLKPGGHLLSFAGSRTYHRMAVNIEDAGFEIRDQIMWVYGSGFPKSHNIGKAVDKLQGNEREKLGTIKTNTKMQGGNYGGEKEDKKGGIVEVTKGNSAYEGWGTALKPAHEPIVVARKPLSEKTIVKNVLEWGTGGINIDGCRVGTGDNLNGGSYGNTTREQDKFFQGKKPGGAGEFKQPLGRFPANFIHDGSDEVTELLGEPARFFYYAKASKKDRNEGLEGFADVEQPKIYADDKWSKENMGNTPAVIREPVKNNHPTVKPTKLMQYLVRLVTPKGGTVLDPFMGSGSTGKAAKLEGFDFIGIELDPEYVKIAEARINSVDKSLEK